MANVSSSNGLEKRPKLRFPGFDEPWKTNIFDEIFSLLPNNTLSRADLASCGDVLNVHYGDVLIKYGSILDVESDEIPYIAAGKESKKQCYLSDGDVIIADTAEDETVGKCTEITNTKNAKIEAGLHTIPCHPRIAYAPMFLGYYMNSPYYHKQLIPLMQGVKVLSVSKSNIGNTLISAPTSYSEQEKIVDLLHLLDCRMRKQQEVIDNLKKYKRGVNNQILSQIDNSYDCRLGSVCEIVGGGTPDTLHTEYWGNTVEWFTPSEIGKTKYVNNSVRKLSDIGLDNSSAKLLPIGTVLLTTRATLGEMSIAKQECSTNQGFQSLIPHTDRVSSEYLYYMQIIIKPWCEKYASGNTFREISKSALSDCIIPIPDRARQEQIVKLLSSIDLIIGGAESISMSLSKIRHGLMQQLFI